MRESARLGHRLGCAGLWATFLVSAVPAAGGAQSLPVRVWPTSVDAGPLTRTEIGAQISTPAVDLGGGIAVPTVLSAVVPGAGQLALGQRRGWLYIALESIGWFGYASYRSSGGTLRDEYRDYAWDVARIGAASRRDGDFDYYETMTKWDRSGDFDTDAGSMGVQPEEDPSTFNGSIWALATALYSASDPRALEYYRERAYADDLSWDWGGDAGRRAELGVRISESDDAFRKARSVLGGVIANHVISAVDAFLSARARSRAPSLDFSARPTPSGLAWVAHASFPWNPLP